MAIKQIAQSHIDHNLSPEQLAWVLSQEAPAGEVKVQTLVLPLDLGTVPCDLHGPAMGDEPVPEDVVIYRVRGERKGPSRLVAGKARQTRKVTIISGPEEADACVLYTAFGGPSSPRELFEDDGPEATAFWAEHALTA